jgi:hypothetical protein
LFRYRGDVLRWLGYEPIAALGHHHDTDVRGRARAQLGTCREPGVGDEYSLGHARKRRRRLDSADNLARDLLKG